VLADETNKGYHTFANTPVKTVNGESFSGIKDLMKKIESYKGEFIEFELENFSKVVLETEKSRAADAGILQRYGITSDRSENLMTIILADPLKIK
jgi:hypothetical protein